MMRKKPMLAYPVSDKPIDYTKPTFIQPKLDGVRCLIQYDNNPTNEYHPKHLRVTAYSRTGKVWKNIDHILFNLSDVILPSAAITNFSFSSISFK